MSVTRVILPKLGLTMEEGRIVAWRKQEGDAVAKGEVLFEVETDKATMEVEAEASGILRKVLVAADASAPVATVIAFIADSAEEPLPDASSEPAAPKPSTPAGASRTGAPVHAPSSGRHPVGRGPSAPPALGDSTDGSERIMASPAAKKRAHELGVDLSSVSGTGPGGRIRIEDIEAAASPGAAASGARAPLSRMRRAVAEAMSRSNREVPQFAISRDVDMTGAGARRKAASVSYTDVIVSACARALRAHPRLRSRYDGDATITSESVHVGVAVALDDGLIVPVLRDADRKDLATLRSEREALEAGARSGRLPANALGGAVITVSNLGTFGVDGFTAIVNPPEASILAVGRVSDRVVSRDGAAVVRPTVTLTLSVDHRVADGADAARFLADVAAQLEG